MPPKRINISIPMSEIMAKQLKTLVNDIKSDPAITVISENKNLKYMNLKMVSNVIKNNVPNDASLVIDYIRYSRQLSTNVLDEYRDDEEEDVEDDDVKDENEEDDE